MRGRIGQWAAAALLGLTGCQSSAYLSARDSYNLADARVLLAQPDELPDHQINRVDGTYKGIVTLLESHNLNCPPTGWGTIDIGDHTLILEYTPALIMTATIQPDGSVFARSGTTVLRGVLHDGRLRLLVSSPVCVSRYDFRYVI